MIDTVIERTDKNKDHHVLQGRLIWLLAGEVSGDIVGAQLMDSLRELDPTLVFAGVGGARMRSRGLISPFPMSDLALMGFGEIVPHLFRLKHRIFDAKQDILVRRPDMILTIDSPSFASRLIEAVSKEFLTRRVHYVAPQVWAWGKWRAKSYERLWHKILCLFPFEPQWFKGTYYESEWVGHPLEEYSGDAVSFRKRHDIPDKSPIVLLMPGSREGEISRLLPHFKKLIENLSSSAVKPTFVMPITEHLAVSLKNKVRRWKNKPIVLVGNSEVGCAYAAATCAVTKSGTVTLQLAQAGVPMVIAHRVHWLSGLFARFLIKVPFIGMVNLLVGEKVVPEYLQADCNDKSLTDAVLHLISNKNTRQKQQESFKQLNKHLKPSATEHPSAIAARAVLKVLDAPIPPV